MAHVTKDEILRASDGCWAEVERLAVHLSACRGCRALATGILAERAVTGKRARIFKMLLELARFDKSEALERLLPKAGVAELRRLTKGAQRERVMLCRSCHSPGFIGALLDAMSSLRSSAETETLANLALLAANGIDPGEASDSFRSDLVAKVWIETANSRRIRSEWQPAHAALRRAEEQLRAEGDPCVRARWLSVAGSLQCDQGQPDDAIALLEECRSIYTERNEWSLVGRTLVQMAHCLVDLDPERALACLDRASILIREQDAGLCSVAGRIRTDCLVTLGRLEDAVRAFAEAERLGAERDEPSASVRSTFIAARVLEAFGHEAGAEALFEAAVADALEQGFFRIAVLDLVYAFGFQLRRGSPERAAPLGLLVLDELDRLDSAASEQFRSVLAQLTEAASEGCLDEPMLQAVRDSLGVRWKHPAPSEAWPGAADPDRRLVEPLVAKALWCSLRHKKRREQVAHVARSPEFHTVSFVELVLDRIRRTPSWDEAEFMAGIALQALKPMETTVALKPDLQLQLWTEVANVRRIAADWTRAQAALRQAERHAAQGSGDPCLRARWQSIAASLADDQGHHAEAIAALETCVPLLERQGAWPLVARTYVKMAHTLVDGDPACSLRLVERAIPLIPSSDASLRFLADIIRTAGLINIGELDLALQVFHQAESLASCDASSVARRRGDFLAARLLEVHGYIKESVQLFELVIADAIEHQAYREAFLDLLYLFELHVRRNATEDAVTLCSLALERLDILDLGHEQLRTVWRELRDASMRQSIVVDSLVEVREFLKVHWKYPAPNPPRFSFG